MIMSGGSGLTDWCSKADIESICNGAAAFPGTRKLKPKSVKEWWLERKTTTEWVLGVLHYNENNIILGSSEKLPPCGPGIIKSGNTWRVFHSAPDAVSPVALRLYLNLGNYSERTHLYIKHSKWMLVVLCRCSKLTHQLSTNHIILYLSMGIFSASWQYCGLACSQWYILTSLENTRKILLRFLYSNLGHPKVCPIDLIEKFSKAKIYRNSWQIQRKDLKKFKS